MSNYTQILNLPTEDVQNVADAYKGYAKILSEQTDTDKSPVMASSWLIGALFQSILEPKKSKELFYRAAIAYRELQMPVWRLCELCVQNDQNLNTDADKKYLYSYNMEDKFYHFLQQINYSPIPISKKYFHRGFEDYMQSNLLIPGLNIPYRLVIDALVDAMQYSISSEKGLHFQNFTYLLVRLNELTDLYQVHEHHWNSLEGEIIPFEPAALAITIVVVKIWLNKVSYSVIYESLKGLTDQQRVLFDIATDILQGKNE